MATKEEHKLKYLEFVQVATIHSLMCFYNLYVRAKERSGTLRSNVETIEVIVMTVVGPVYDKFHDVPGEALKYLDGQVHKSVVSVWRKINKLPLFAQMAQVVVPTASYYGDKYNGAVRSAAEKGYRVSSYLPFVPTQRIAKVFGDEVPESKPLIS